MGILKVDVTKPATYTFIDGKGEYYSLDYFYKLIDEQNQKLWTPVYNNFYNKFEADLLKDKKHDSIYYGNIKDKQLIEFLTFLGFQSRYDKINYQSISYDVANFKREGTYTSGYSGEVDYNGDVHISENRNSYEYTETVLEIYGVGEYSFDMRTMYSYCEKHEGNNLLEKINELFNYFERYNKIKRGSSKRIKGTTFFMKFFMFNAIFLTLALGIVSHICLYGPAAKSCLIPALVIGGLEFLFRGIFGLLYIKYSRLPAGFCSDRTPITYTLIPVAGILVSILSTVLTANGNNVDFLVWLGSMGNYFIFGWHFWAFFLGGDFSDLTEDARDNDKSISEFKKFGGLKEYENQIQAVREKLK